MACPPVVHGTYVRTYVCPYMPFASKSCLRQLCLPWFDTWLWWRTPGPEAEPALPHGTKPTHPVISQAPAALRPYPTETSAGMGGGQAKTPSGKSSLPNHFEIKIIACTNAFVAMPLRASSKTRGV